MAKVYLPRFQKEDQPESDISQRIFVLQQREYNQGNATAEFLENTWNQHKSGATGKS